MCGIAGFIGDGDERTLRHMTDTLRHRGPDDEGFFISGRTHLGMRRLSIIDLSTGKQPQSNEDGTVTVVFNGEIYNYPSLRKKLESTHTFKTRSDTEVLVHLWEEKGENMVSELDGMFAIALWDAKKEMLFLARDRFGEKPLYWTKTPETFLFGSELKALAAHPAFKKEFNEAGALRYLYHHFTPTPETIWNNVFRLPAAHALIFKDGRERIFSWREYPKNPGANQIPFETAKAELDAKLAGAVESRMISDVPLGILLSGGVDSSTVAYYARKISPNIKAFTIGFAERSYDESETARLAAQRTGVTHRLKTFSEHEVVNEFEKLTTMLDEPFADASLLPTALLCRFAREEVTVALDGDGADELFGGYEVFKAQAVARILGTLPEGAVKGIGGLIRTMLPASREYMSASFMAERFFGNYKKDVMLRQAEWTSAINSDLISKIVQRPLGDSLFKAVTNRNREARDLNDFQRSAYYYISSYLQDDILMKTDRAGMYHSLEVRVPFLDPRVADFAISLPQRYKVRGLKRSFPAY
ncbi:MAG: asparagine synthase (glutamine-hydrolyzing) [Candidatus Sungbacteria bacterium]|nr:asparagine synthase (glutamine-hydrolyzing) [Candidatus Sungbacteria bacterium]